MIRERGALPIHAAVLGGLAIVFFAPGILAGQVPIFRDLLVLVLPLRDAVRDAVRSGHVPLWTDGLFFGAPLVADYQSAVFYPPSLLLYVLPLPLGLSLFLALHLFLAGYGMSRYLVRRGLGPGAALLGGIVFAFGGFLTSLVPLTNHLEVAAWLPWVLDAADRLTLSGHARWFVRLAVLIALQGLCGAPEPLLLTLGLVAATSLPQTRAPGRWLAVGLACGLGLLLCAVQLLPTAEYARLTERSGGLSLESATAESLSFRSLLQFALPHLFHDGGPGFVPEGGVPLVWSLYVGIIPLALAVPRLVRLTQGPWPVLFWGSLLLSLGASTAVFPLLHGIAPGLFGAFRFPVKFFFVASFAVALLAAEGLERVTSDSRARRAATLVLETIAIFGTVLAAVASQSPRFALFLAGYVLPPDLGEEAARLLASRLSLLALRGTLFALFGAGIVWLLARERMSVLAAASAIVAAATIDVVAAHAPTVVFTPWQELLEVSRPLATSMRPGSRIFHYCAAPSCPSGGSGFGTWVGGLQAGDDVRERALELSTALVGDLPMLHALGAVTGSDGFATRDQQAFFRAVSTLPRSRAVHLLEALGVRHLIGREATEMPAGVKFRPGSWPIRYDLPDPAPRTYLAARVLSAPDVSSALELVSAAEFRSGRDAVIVGAAGDTVESGGGIEQSVVHSRGGTSAVLELATAGLWVVGDAWYPGWVATIDDQTTEILRVNGFLRGVRVPPGIHRVEMRYRPGSFDAGVLVSLGAVFLLLIVAVYSSRRPSTS